MHACTDHIGIVSAGVSCDGLLTLSAPELESFGASAVNNSFTVLDTREFLRPVYALVIDSYPCVMHDSARMDP